jgi:hypothetical protein
MLKKMYIKQLLVSVITSAKWRIEEEIIVYLCANKIT